MKVATIERTMLALRRKGWSEASDSYDRLLFVLGIVGRELRIQRKELRAQTGEQKGTR